jgi:hypothetical protein
MFYINIILFSSRMVCHVQNTAGICKATLNVVFTTSTILMQEMAYYGIRGMRICTVQSCDVRFFFSRKKWFIKLDNNKTFRNIYSFNFRLSRIRCDLYIDMRSDHVVMIRLCDSPCVVGHLEYLCGSRLHLFYQVR